MNILFTPTLCGRSINAPHIIYIHCLIQKWTIKQWCHSPGWSPVRCINFAGYCHTWRLNGTPRGASYKPSVDGSPILSKYTFAATPPSSPPLFALTITLHNYWRDKSTSVSFLLYLLFIVFLFCFHLFLIPLLNSHLFNYSTLIFDPYHSSFILAFLRCHTSKLFSQYCAGIDAIQLNCMVLVLLV